MYRQTILCLILLWTALPAAVTAEQPQNRSEPDWLILLQQGESGEPEADTGYTALERRLLATHPALRAKYLHWQSLTAKAGIAGARPDPRLNAAYALNPVVTAQGPQQFRLGISQSLPWPAQRGAAEATQVARSQVARKDLERLGNDLILDLKLRYGELYLLQRKVSIQTQLLAILHNWEQVLLNRYRSASVRHPDLIKTQLEVLRRQDELRQTQVALANARSGLRELLSLPPGDSLQVPDQLPAATVHVVEDGQFSANPRLQMQRHALEAAREQERYLRTTRRPQFSVSLDWVFIGSSGIVNPALESGADALSAGLGLSLPVWRGKNQAEEQFARQQVQSDEQALAAIEQELRAAWEQLVRKGLDARRRVGWLEESMLPKARQNYAVLETAYTAGEADLLELLDALESLLAYELKLEQARVDLWNTDARIQHLKGALS